MEDNKRSFGESARESAKLGDQHTGHGVEDVGAREVQPTIQRTERTERTERSGTEPAARRESVPAADVAGNDQPAGRKLPSPLSRPGGCTAPTGAMFIAMVSLLGARLKPKRGKQPGRTTPKGPRP